MTKSRVIWGFIIAVVLITIALAVLYLADAYAMIDDAKRCAPSLLKTQWPGKWLGCAMSAHEGLAGGLLAAVGALFAAWLAFDSIQEQLREERQHRQEQETLRQQQQYDAKVAAVVCITQPVHAAAATLAQINAALGVRQSGVLQDNADRLVKLAIDHVRMTLESFTVRESTRDLAIDDRVMYLLIVNTLSTFLNVSAHPSPLLSRENRLENQRHALMRLHSYLRPLDAELANVFARDSGTTAPATRQ